MVTISLLFHSKFAILMRFTMNIQYWWWTQRSSTLRREPGWTRPKTGWGKPRNVQVSITITCIFLDFSWFPKEFLTYFLIGFLHIQIRKCIIIVLKYITVRLKCPTSVYSSLYSLKRQTNKQKWYEYIMVLLLILTNYTWLCVNHSYTFKSTQSR